MPRCPVCEGEGGWREPLDLDETLYQECPFCKSSGKLSYRDALPFWLDRHAPEWWGELVYRWHTRRSAMPDYNSLTDDELVAEVARRMPADLYGVYDGSCVLYNYSLGGWAPVNCKDRIDMLVLIDDVKREIERRGWRYHHSWWPEHGHSFVIDTDIDEFGLDKGTPSLFRQIAIAYLRATDAEKEASSEG